MIEGMIVDSEKFWDEDELVRKDPSKEPREEGRTDLGSLRYRKLPNSAAEFVNGR
jgi:hypothetical protein